MALVATINYRKKNKDGTHTVTGTLAWDSSYPTGGESYSTTLGDNVLNIRCHPYKGYTFEPDYTNKKILAYALSVAGGAAAAGTDALSVKSGVLSKESAGAAHAPMREVQSTGDLSALTAAPFEADLLRI